MKAKSKMSMDEVKIIGMFALWRSAYLAKKKLDFTYGVLSNPANQAKAALEINKLSGIAKPFDLLHFMQKTYKYIEDPYIGKLQLDIPTDSMVTAFTKQGDCEDLAMLVEKVYPGGQFLDILQLTSNGYKGHNVYWDSNCDVWSARSAEEGLVIDMAVTDVTKIPKFYNKNWTHVVKWNKNINIIEIMPR